MIPRSIQERMSPKGMEPSVAEAEVGQLLAGDHKPCSGTNSED